MSVTYTQLKTPLINSYQSQPSIKHLLHGLMRWSQLCFDFDLTVVRLRFNCNSTTLRLRYGLQVLFWDAAEFSATAASGLCYWDRNDL